MKPILLFFALLAGFLTTQAQQSGSAVMSIFANGKNPDFDLNPLYRTPPQTFTVRCKTIFLRSGETMVVRLRKAKVHNLDSAKVVGTVNIRQDNEWVEFAAKVEKGEYFWVDVISGPLKRVQGALNVCGRAGENNTDINWYLAQELKEGERMFSITAKGAFTDGMDDRDRVKLRIRTAKVYNLDSARVVGEVQLDKNQREAKFPMQLRENHFYWIDVVNSSIDYKVNLSETHMSATGDLTYFVQNIKTHKQAQEQVVSTPPSAVSPAPPPATPQTPSAPAVVHTSPLPTVQTVSPSALPAGSVRDLDGNVYSTITLGNLIWFQENLRTTQYNDTTPIRMIMEDVAWRDAQLGAYCLYENKTENESMFGKLYNGHAVATGKLCPLGWRVPTDEDWKDLERSIGLPADELNRTGGRGGQGDKLKTTNQWQTSSYVNTNETGFSALPAGARMSNGDFKVKDQYADFWTSTVYDNPYSLYLWNRHLYYNSHELGRMYMSANNGFSCRCVKDK